MNYTIFLPVLIAFGLSVMMGPVIIPILRKLKMGQTERVDGVQSHLKKAGTPTMGGVIILLSVVITSVFYIKDYPKIIPILFVTLGFGLIGQCVYGRYGFSGSWRICSIYCIHAADAGIYRDCWIDLSDRSVVCYDPGNLF